MIIAFDSFKGCLSSSEAGRAFADGLGENDAQQACCLTLSDGGEGMLQAYQAALGGQKVTLRVHDALMRPIEAAYLLQGDKAVIEVAQACGLAQIEPEQRNPVVATSYGVGELIAHAVFNGARHLIVGLGGTATSDCGIGMIQAIIRLMGKAGETIDDVKKRHFIGVSFTLASDVDNPLYGETGAAKVFAPQKGATPEMVRIIEKRAQRFDAIASRHTGVSHSNDSGAGAAGGLGYALMQFFDAKKESGAELLLRLCHFDELLQHHDVVVTGEGCSDSQTLMGKLPGVILQHAKQLNVPVHLRSGLIRDKEQLLQAGFATVESINPEGADLSESLRPSVAKARLASSAQHITGDKEAVPN